MRKQCLRIYMFYVHFIINIQNMADTCYAKYYIEGHPTKF